MNYNDCNPEIVTFPTRVLIFIGSLIGGGAERVSAALAGYLVVRGYEVTLVTMNSGKHDFYAVDYRVQRISMNLTGENAGLGKVIANIKRILALRAFIRKQRADVVIGMITTSAILAILACLGLPTKVIVSERNFPGRKATDAIWALLRKALYRSADIHVAQTREIAVWLERNVSARNIQVIANSVVWPLPEGLPRVVPSDVVDPSSRVALAVGNKAEQKGFDLLVSAFARVARDRRDWQLVILGLGSDEDRTLDQRKRLMRLADELDVVDRFHLPGRVGNMADWYQRADLFVLSSRFEGFPNVLLEAMAAGCACVAFDCDTGPRDIITDGRDGLLVPAEDVEALATAMADLMDDDELRSRLGAVATEVRQRFSEERILGQWRALIDGLTSVSGQKV